MITFILSLFLTITPPSDFYWYPATLEKCYDADTCTLSDVDLGQNIHRHDVTVRLFGINAPELRGEEKAQGEISRDYLLSLIHPNDQVLIHTEKDESGKYGRLLATIFYQCNDGWCNANENLLINGYAKPYGE